MKTKLFSIILLIFLLCIFIPTYADDKFDATEWTFVMLTGRSDQDRDVIVSRIYKKTDKSKYAFCLEPKQLFSPLDYIYYESANNNEYIHSLVKSYDQIGTDDDNYFIATQLLIWKEISGIDYSFDGNYYNDYKDILINNIKNIETKSKQIENITIDINEGEKVYLDGDYTEYRIENDNVDVVSNTKEGIELSLKEYVNEQETIDFFPINEQTDEIIYASEDSQDIYFYNPDSVLLEPFEVKLNIKKKDELFDIKYSKKTTDGRSITGAEFSLYQIDDKGDIEIVFIKKGISNNLYEILLDDYSSYSNLSIEVSERYSSYLDNGLIVPKELGSFPYKIYENSTLIKEGIIYVTDNNILDKNKYSKTTVSRIFKGYSADLEVNTINDIPTTNDYYLCESKPSNGYTYVDNPCVLVESDTYDDEVIDFVNEYRTYNLKLMKQSPNEVLLNGAEFKITYYDDDLENTIRFITGEFYIERENNYKYLIYKYENDDNVNVVEFNDDFYSKNVNNDGKYYYYQSNSKIIDEKLLSNNYVNVLKGGFEIKDLPYSCKLIIEETKAPNGFMITDPIYEIEPNIGYDDITFKNYRVNLFDIIPAKYIIPNTCVN